MIFLSFLYKTERQKKRQFFLLHLYRDIGAWAETVAIAVENIPRQAQDVDSLSSSSFFCRIYCKASLLPIKE
jgi:hypothetical protein